MTAWEQDSSLNIPGEDYWSEAELLARALVDRLDYFEALGITELPLSLAPPPANSPEMIKPAAAMVPTVIALPPRRPQGKSAINSESTEWPVMAATTLSQLQNNLALCRVCPEPTPPPQLGQGSLHPKVVVVGLHPGAINTPSRVERLTNMLNKVLELQPQQYHVTTVVKCAGAKDNEDEDPSPTMLQTCQPIIFKELELLRPQIVLGLGEKVGQILSGLDFPLGLLRPQNHKISTLPHIWLRVTYSLEDLEDSVELRQETWKDLQKLKSGLNTLASEEAQTPETKGE